MTYPSGITAPLTSENGKNHSGLIVVITAFHLVLVLASVIARIYSVYQQKTIQHNNYLFGGLVVVAIAQASTVLAGVHYGWGTQAESLTVEDRNKMLKAVYAADILSVIVLGLSKTAMCILYEVLFAQTNRRFIRVILVGTFAWILISSLLLAIRCGKDPWSDISSSCHNLFPIWLLITALDIVSEISLILYSGFEIYKVNIPAKKKLIVFLLLECRILLVGLAVSHFYYLKKQLDSDYPTLLGAYATTTTEIYLSLSVICLITSSLKSFIAVYEDKDEISKYTAGASQSRCPPKSIIGGPKIPTSNNVVFYTSTVKVDLSKGRERMDEEVAMMIDPNNSGLQILKTVHHRIWIEPIELEERRSTTL